MLSYINYGLLLCGVEVKNLEIIQKRAIRLITGSNYIAHTEPLFIQLGLLKVQDIFKLRLLKFYYKFCYGTLPHYFDNYREIIIIKEDLLKINKIILRLIQLFTSA